MNVINLYHQKRQICHMEVTHEKEHKDKDPGIL